MIGFSIGRNYYTLQLRLPGTDAGLTSGVVVIWLEIQLAYALAASTLSASKAFTESFNSGFGLGFTRGKGEDSYGNSYGLSDVGKSTPNSSKNEKSRNNSALESVTVAGRSQSQLADNFGESGSGVGVLVSPITPTPKQGSVDDDALKLRPETGIRTFTQVSAEPELGPWRDGSSAASERSGDDMVIMRETGYEVQHDRAPILPI